MAGQGQIEEDIEEAKEVGDTPRAAELLGKSIHYRGLQDELTPPGATSLTVGYYLHRAIKAECEHSNALKAHNQRSEEVEIEAPRD